MLGQRQRLSHCLEKYIDVFASYAPVSKLRKSVHGIDIYLIIITLYTMKPLVCRLLLFCLDAIVDTYNHLFFAFFPKCKKMTYAVFA